MATISNDAIVVYLILRADISTRETIVSKSYRKSHGLLVSGLDMQTVAQRAGLSDMTVNRVMNELYSKEWVRKLKFSKESSVYQLGYIDGFEGGAAELREVVWFSVRVVEKPKVLEKSTLTSTAVRRRLAESRKRVSAERAAKTTLTPERKYRMSVEAGIAKPKKYHARLLDRYKEYYENKFGHRLNLAGLEDTSARKAYEKTYRQLKYLIGWCGDNWVEAAEYLEWCTDNWKEVKKNMRMVGEFKISSVSSKKVFTIISRWREHGFPELAPHVDVDGVGSRGTEDKHEEETSGGW